MTVTNATLESSLFSGNGVTTAFATGFQFDNEADIQVILRASDGTETVQALTTHYTVSGEENPAGGTVTMVTPPAVGERLRIVRNLSYTQGVDYTEGTAFPAEAHEGALDKLTQLTQQLAHELNRAPKLKTTSSNYPAEFPDGGADKAGFIFRWNTPAGTSLEAVDPVDAITGAETTPFSRDLLADASASEARTTLGLGTLATQDGTFSGTSSGSNTGDQNLFGIISVAGQSDVVADSANDTLTLVAGTNVTITTDAATDTITINATSGGGGASTSNRYVTTQAESNLSNEFSLGGLTSGILKHTVSTGVSTPATAVQGTDYWAPGGTDVAVADGGSGRSSATAYAVLCGGTTTTGAHQSVASVGTAGQVLTSNGAGALPTFQSGGSGAWVKISSATASNSASIDFTGLNSTYRMYEVVLNDVVPATDAVDLYLRTSANNGSSYDSGTSDYKYHTTATVTNSSGGAPLVTGAFINLANIDAPYTLGNNTGEVANGFVQIYNPSASSRVRVISQIWALNSYPYPSWDNVQGWRDTVAAVNAIRFYMSAGNIASGTFTLYGLVA